MNRCLRTVYVNLKQRNDSITIIQENSLHHQRNKHSQHNVQSQFFKMHVKFIPKQRKYLFQYKFTFNDKSFELITIRTCTYLSKISLGSGQQDCQLSIITNRNILVVLNLLIQLWVIISQLSLSCKTLPLIKLGFNSVFLSFSFQCIYNSGLIITMFCKLSQLVMFVNESLQLLHFFHLFQFVFIDETILKEILPKKRIPLICQNFFHIIFLYSF